MDANRVGRHTTFAKLANFTGVPAITSPMGFDENDMPIGFQLMGNWVN